MKPTKLALAITLTSTLFSTNLTYAEVGVTDESVLLGMVNVQTGPASALGQGMLKGASAVFDDINQAGGVHGRQIELLVADDGYEPDMAIDETLAMIEDEEVFSLFGYVGTPTANAVLPIVKDTEVPLVGLFTGAGSLRKPITRQVFNVRSSYDDEAEAMVNHFLANGAKTVGVFYQNDGFGKAVLSGAKKALQKHDMDVHVTGTFERNTVAVKSGLGKIMKDAPDAIVMVGTYAPLAEFVKQARKAGLDSMMSTVSFVGTKNLASAMGDAGDGVIITQVVPSPAEHDIAVVNDCRKLVEADGSSTLDYINLEGCLSAKVMVEALQKAGPELDRDTLIATLEGMEDVDLGGLKLGFSADSHQ
ncbi:MAG: ABC transporter substrate-binding protein, partial [Granulosicoccaceae bacterium]